MADMNAIAITEFAKPAVLIRRPVPKPAAGEVLLKVVAVGLNPYDHRARDIGLFINPASLPMVLGNDIAGIVTAVGPPGEYNVDVKVGDLIFGQSNHSKQTADQAGLQEYCLLDAYTTAKVPAGFTADHGASLPSNAVAAFWALFNPASLGLPTPFGTTTTEKLGSIVVVGAGSNCGRYAVQFARLSGLFSTIVAVAGPGRASELKSLGATHVVDRHGDEADVIARTREVVGDDCLYVIDAVNHEHTLAVGITSTSRKGKVATLCPGEADLSRIAEKKAGVDKVFSAGASHNAPELARQFWGALPGWLESGKVKALEWDVIQGLDVDAINAVWDGYRDGKSPAKQIHVHL
ncbi:putative alcohol dehydrogenase [Xylogone sp. PMI_703]|nr:putative alcohol dehydrogenase [Xylogone sp. PMI_703]